MELRGLVVGLLLIHSVVAKQRYIPTAVCSEKEKCYYKYASTQISKISGVSSVFEVAAKVEISCNTVGLYNAQEATQFCMTIKDPVIRKQELSESMEDVLQSASDSLSGPFCFVQTSEGKITSVQHDPTETIAVVNFKKAIAAAFQANFKKTAEEVEEDTQSRHVSYYRYESKSHDHLLMHRTVGTDDILQFASTPSDVNQVTVQKAEDVEYYKGRLHTSSGTTVVLANGPVEQQIINQDFYEESDGNSKEGLKSNYHMTYDNEFGTAEFGGKGQYSLTLQQCIQNDSNSDSIIEGAYKDDIILAQRIERHADDFRMGKSSIHDNLALLHQNISNNDIRMKIRKQLILENSISQDDKQALPSILEYLKELSLSKDRDDIEMRVLLYSFLTTEGSHAAQKVLLHGIENTGERKERNTLAAQVAFIHNPHPHTLQKIEHLITTSNESTDSLFLSYGALASKLPEETKLQMVNFLLNYVKPIQNNSDLVHIIHALGNTESNVTNKILVNYLKHPDPNVQLAAVYALRYGMDSTSIQSEIINMLHSKHGSKQFVEMVLRALIAGAEWNGSPKVQPIQTELFEALVGSAKDDQSIFKMLLHYTMLIGESLPPQWTVLLSHHVNKRGTTQWNSADQLYNLILSKSDRDYDVETYPCNKAYLWGKSLGIPVLKLEAAFGSFAGFGCSKEHPTNFKLFAKGIVKGYAFKRSKTAFEALLFSEKKPESNDIKSRVYFNIVGKVLADKNSDIPTCKTWNFPLYSSPDYSLITFSVPIFIYVGFLTFALELKTRLGVDANLGACITDCVSVQGSLEPSVALIASAQATASILELVRGGIELSGQVEYKVYISLIGNYQLRDKSSELCTKVSHGWPNNHISINTFYQLRTIKLCTQGFFKKVVKGIKKGTKKLLKGVTKGVKKGAKKLLKGVTKGVKKGAKKLLKGVTKGVKKGAKKLFKGVTKGVKKGAKKLLKGVTKRVKKGAKKLLKGITKGVKKVVKGVKKLLKNIKFPCGIKWGKKRIWKAASKTWKLPSGGPYVLWSANCNRLKLQCPAF